jgi:L-lactate dehydrogenase (cytochrome)
MFDPALTVDDLEWLRGIWKGPLLVKGIQSAADARLVTEHGADGVIVSSHGGRQLDRGPVPLELLPAVLDAVGGDAEVYLDTGVLTGADILAAVALGARGCLVGRAYLYGLMAGGERGVARAAAILRSEITRTLQLLGLTAVDQLTPGHVRLRPR